MDLTLNKSQKDLAKELNVSDGTVRRVIDHLDETFKPNYHWLLRHIVFDNFKSERFAPSGMSMILMNIENKRTLDIINSRSNTYLRNHFLRYALSTFGSSNSLYTVPILHPNAISKCSDYCRPLPYCRPSSSSSKQN